MVRNSNFLDFGCPVTHLQTMQLYLKDFDYLAATSRSSASDSLSKYAVDESLHTKMPESAGQSIDGRNENENNCKPQTCPIRRLQNGFFD